MTSEKSVLTETRFNALITGGGSVLTEAAWTDFGTYSAGWAKVGGANYRFRMIFGGPAAGLVMVQMQNLNASSGTTTNGTTILSAANGLPAGYRPGVASWIPVRCDNEGSQTSAFMFGPDGHVECWGIGATATRVDVNVIFYAEA